MTGFWDQNLMTKVRFLIKIGEKSSKIDIFSSFLAKISTWFFLRSQEMPFKNYRVDFYKCPDLLWPQNHSELSFWPKLIGIRPEISSGVRWQSLNTNGHYSIIEIENYWKLGFPVLQNFRHNIILKLTKTIDVKMKWISDGETSRTGLIHISIIDKSKGSC